MLDLNTNSAASAHMEAEKALSQNKNQNKMDSLDLDYYKKLHEAAGAARKELEEVKLKLADTESKAVYTSGAVSAFSEYVQTKYNLSKEDSIDAETGMIERA